MIYEGEWVESKMDGIAFFTNEEGIKKKGFYDKDKCLKWI